MYHVNNSTPGLIQEKVHYYHELVENHFVKNVALNEENSVYFNTVKVIDYSGDTKVLVNNIVEVLKLM